jgi:hypothetical protein
VNVQGSFVPFGTTHLVTILLLVLMGIALVWGVRRWATTEQARNIAMVVGVFMIVQEIFDRSCHHFLNGEPLRQVLPFHLAMLLTDSEPVNKASFSSCGDDQFNGKLIALARRQVLLCGIEAHVCIYQTAVDLLCKGFSVDVVADAISSRSLENKQLAIQRMAAAGANITSVEMSLFELLKTADHPHFKQIAKLMK